jgi:hypothetical protein
MRSDIEQVAGFPILSMLIQKFCGKVAEWLKAHAWKACIR